MSSLTQLFFKHKSVLNKELPIQHQIWAILEFYSFGKNKVFLSQQSKWVSIACYFQLLVKPFSWHKTIIILDLNILYE